MSSIRINIDSVRSLSPTLQQKSVKVSNIKRGVSSIRYNLNYKIMARRNIRSRIQNVYNSSHELEKRLRDLQGFINNAANRYSEADDIINKSVILTNISSNAAKVYDSTINSYGYKFQNVNIQVSASKNNTNGDGLTEDKGESWLDKMNGFISDVKKDLFTESLTIGVSSYCKLPELKVDGDYIKILNSEYYKGGEGLARRYTLNNIKAGRYPKATNLYNISKSLKWLGNVATVTSVVDAVCQDYEFNPNISTERKISNAAVVALETVVVGKVGGAIGRTIGRTIGGTIGGAIGSIVPGPGTVVGTVIGSAVGMVAGYFIDKALKEWKIWDGGSKSTLDVVKDFVGDGVEKVVSVVGVCAKQIKVENSLVKLRSMGQLKPSFSY